MFLALLLALAVAPGSPLVAKPKSARFAEIARRAEASRASNDLAEALRLYKEGLALNPGWEEGFWHVGTLSYELDLYAEGKEAFRRFVTAKPEGGAGWAFLGLCEYRLGDYELALEHLERALLIGVGQPEQLQSVTRYHAGLLFSRFGKFEQAWERLDALARKNDDNADVVNGMGIVLLRLPLLPHEVPQEKRELVLLAGRAAYAQAAQRVEGAKLAYSELLQRHGNVPNVHYAYGVFLLSGDTGAALEQFRRELEVSPAHLEARLQLAYELHKRGDYDAGLPFAEEAVRIAPTNFMARHVYGRLLLGKEDTEGAIRQLEAAVAAAPGSAPVHFALQRAYALAGRMEDAKREMAIFEEIDTARREIIVAENWMRTNPRDASAHRALAEAYRKGRRREEAAREIRAAEYLEAQAGAKVSGDDAGRPGEGPGVTP